MGPERLAFRMQLKAGMEDAYQQRHAAIWPELVELLRDAGISDYSIFLDRETLALFATLKLDETNDRAALPDHPVMRRWWDHMAPLMEVQPGNQPREWPLALLFHMD